MMAAMTTTSRSDAAADATVEPDPAPSRRESALILLVGFAGLALIVALVAMGFAARDVSDAKRVAAGTSSVSGTSSGGSATAATMVHLSEFTIDPASVSVPAGSSIQVMNTGTMQHNLAVQGQNLATAMIQPGATATLALTGLAPGSYTLYCQVPGHIDAGMKAQLTVTAAGTAPSSSSSSGVTAAAASPPSSASSADMDATMAVSTKAFPAKTAGLGGQDLAPKVLPDGTKQFDLTAKVVKWEVSPGHLVDAWTYNGTVPGPTMHVNPGDKVQIILHNELPESTVIHWHGIQVPNAMDGVPYITQDPIKPGQTFIYSWTAQSTPAVGMYHSHFDAAKQVPNGLAGAFLIGTEPLPAGATVSQQQIMMLNDTGTLGLTINGKSFPATAPIVAKLGQWVEVQYLNEGVMAHPMHLHGLTQLVIAKDGFPLAQPEQDDTVLVAPGERYTVLVHADQLGTWAWHCHILTHAENDSGMFGMVTALVVQPA